MVSRGGDSVRRLVLLVPVLILAVLSASPVAGRDRVTIHLKWLHGSQFAGLYAGALNGLFAAADLEVELIPGAATEDVLVALADGAYDFVLADPTTHLSLVSQGVRNVAVAAVFQIDPVVIFALAESGIRSPGDLLGKRIMSFPSSYVIPAVLGRAGLTVEDVVLGPRSLDLFDLYSGAYDAWSGYVTTEVRRARADGHDLNVIYPTDYGVHLYGDVLLARDSLVEMSPNLVWRVVRAVIDGWAWVLDHVEEAADLVLQWDPSLDRDEQCEILRLSLPFIHAGEVQLGAMTDEKWLNMASMMVQFGLLPAGFDPMMAYTLDFVKPVYTPTP